jgi:LysM repeat protein
MHATAVQEMSGFSYTVRKGDTISTISRRFHINTASLLAMNHGSRRLHLGQRFTILPGSTHPRYAAKKGSHGNRTASNTKAKHGATKSNARLASN